MKEDDISPATRMRVRLKAFIACVLFALIVYYILGMLSDTQLHTKTDVDSFQPPASAYQGVWYGGQTLLEELGFVQNPRLFPQAYHDDENIPVVITAADSESYPELILFLKSFRLYFPEKRLVVYNMGLTGAERDSVIHSSWSGLPLHRKWAIWLSIFPDRKILRNLTLNPA